MSKKESFSLIVSGVDPQINRVNRWEGEQNPFYQFFREEYLGPLSREACIQMIRTIGGLMALVYSDEAAAFVADVSGGHPFVARQLCRVMVDDLRHDSIDGTGTIPSKLAEEITLANMQSVAARFIRDPETAALLDENGLWGEVASPKLWPASQVQESKAVLTTLAKVDCQPEPVLLANGLDQRAREQSVFELKKRAVLRKDELLEMLHIQMRLFQNWIRRYQLHEE